MYKATYLVVLDKKNKVTTCFKVGETVLHLSILKKRKQVLLCTDQKVIVLSADSFEPQFLVAYSPGSVYSTFEFSDEALYLSVDSKVYTIKNKALTLLYDTENPLLPILSMNSLCN